MSFSIKKASPYLLISILVIGAYAGYTLSRPLPLLPPVASSSLPIQSTTSKLIWPAEGQSAVGILGTSIISVNKPATPTPTASTAKMITALMVLRAKPLELNQSGPSIILGPSDVAIYNTYVGEQGSVIPVISGENITEYQMLEAMLLPSANNMADSLAIWAYGSMPEYLKAANAYLAQLDLKSTRVGADASGFIPSTLSSAQDLVKIGELVMENPVLAQIVSQPSASGIPLVNSVKNINYLLGSNNIIGVKTGNTDQAGGVFVGAAKVNLGSKTVIIVTANMGAATLGQAVSGSLPLIKSAESNFINVSLIQNGAQLISYTLPWSKSKVYASLDKPVSAVVWGGSSVHFRLSRLQPLAASRPTPQLVGDVSSQSDGLVIAGKSSLVVKQRLVKPSQLWRLSHI